MSERADEQVPMRNSHRTQVGPWRTKWKTAVICVLLLVMVAIVYGQTCRHEFVNYDDDRYVYRNPSIIAGLTIDGVAQAFTRRELGLWTPLITISHMVDWQLYGSAAGGHHLTNVVLHGASTLLLFLLLRKMTGALWCSAFVAAVFGVHPLRVESVAWIAERKDVLSGLFFMLTLGAYLHYVRRPGSWMRYGGVVLLFSLGLMCKPMLVTVPFVLLLLDYWPLRRLFWPTEAGRRLSFNARVLLEKVPLLFLALAFTAVTMLGPQNSASLFHAKEDVPFLTRIAEAPVWFVVYLGQMIWPANLAPIYTHPERVLPWWPAALLVLIALSLGAFFLRERHPYLWMGWLWNLGMLVPVSGIVQISRHAQADHYNYLPQIGLYLGLSWLAADCTRGRPHRSFMLGSAATAVLGALSFVAYRQTSYWKDDFTLWKHTLASTRDNSIAHSSLAHAMLEKGQPEDAIIQYQEALRIDPALPDAQTNLGNAHVAQGRVEEAITHYRQALRVDPGFPYAGNNLGSALLKLGKVDEAIAQYRETLRLNPLYPGAHYNLGNALVRKGQMQEAIEEYRAAIRIDPSRADAQSNLGSALLKQGQTEEAIVCLKKALALQPGNRVFQNGLAWALATAPDASLRDGPRALQLATEASQSGRSSDPVMLDTLAAAHAAAGDFPKAVQAAERAVALAEAAAQTELASGIRQRLQLYQARQSYSDPGNTR